MTTRSVFEISSIMLYHILDKTVGKNVFYWLTCGLLTGNQRHYSLQMIWVATKGCLNIIYWRGLLYDVRWWYHLNNLIRKNPSFTYDQYNVESWQERNYSKQLQSYNMLTNYVEIPNIKSNRNVWFCEEQKWWQNGTKDMGNILSIDRNILREIKTRKWWLSIS